MSDQENFLARWSRRKLAPDEKVPAQPADASPADEQSAKATAAPARQGESASPEFDVSKLPPLDSIGADSDIRAFLQAGVPSALKHAALRRAWSADPAIRDFVGLNENFWEGVGMENVPGFGALDPSVDVTKLARQILGEAETTVRVDASPPTEANNPTPVAEESSPSETKKQLAQNTDSLLQSDMDAAPQHDESDEPSAATKARRHGGALPR